MTDKRSSAFSSGINAHPIGIDDSNVLPAFQNVYSAMQKAEQEISNVNRFIAIALVNLNAGEYVSVIRSGGVAKLQKASAATNTSFACGFVLDNVVAGEWAVALIVGNNYKYPSALSEGTLYYLSDTVAGAVTSVKPVGAGKIVQPIGFAASATELITNISLNFTQL